MEFLCPRGHKIRCPEQHVGRAAKCPKCGLKFRIPDPSSAETLPSSDTGSAVSLPELIDSANSGTATPGQPEASDRKPQIEFLCPNGHRLHGSASLQGKPGQCPECGSKFRIPTYDEVPEGEKIEQGIALGGADGHDPSGAALPLAKRTAGSRPASRSGIDSRAQHVARGHPLATLFSKLWAERPHGAAVELHLRDGETFVPDRFAEALSRQGHGVFAVKESGGTHTLTVVAWDSVVRVVVRGVAKLPEEMSDSGP